MYFYLLPLVYARSHLRHHSSMSIEEDPDRCNYSWDRGRPAGRFLEQISRY